MARPAPIADEPRVAAASAATLKQSASAVRRSTEAQEESADRRTELAADRTVLAAERTYAAWVRTGLAALASGVGARALLDHVIPTWLAAATGAVLSAFAAFCFVAGVWRELEPGAPPPRPDTPRIPRLLLLTVNGFLVLVALAAVVGVVVTRG
jgi:putative membrane protein